jgi:hypothetical protein
MAYIVIALGVVMALAGGYLLNYGYAIVQVERGWSSVIAGSVFLAGGLTIVCIGLLIRTVGRLGRLANTLPAAASAEPTLRHEPEEPASMAASAALASAVPLAAEVHAHDHEPATETQDWHTDHSEAHSFADEPDTVSEEAPPPVAEPAPLHHVEPAPVVEPEPVDAKHDAPAPAMDDWLDRAFSDLDQEPLPRAATAPLTLEPEPVPEPAHAEHEAEAPTTVQDTIPAEAVPHGEASQSAVIGRYESDGTSYIMYADGSIEAQSAAGVYRFSSMSELKSFIES